MQAVVQELRGEKIDIVPYDRDPARYIINAIQPAEVNKVIVDEADHRMELVVPDEKLSLAIGRKGQNVRLASQLTGWKLDIISESKFQPDGGRGADRASRDRRHRRRASPSRSTGSASAPSRRSTRRRSTSSSASTPSTRKTKAKELKKGAEQAMERLRRDRIREALSTGAPLTDKDKLRFVRGIGQRTLALLEDAGYASPQQVAREDPDRLAIKTGLGNKKARQIHQGAQHFLANEAREIEVAKAELFGAQPGAEG